MRHVYSFSGFAGSGKDTAANELQRITDGHSIAFADPLKDVAAVAFGWDREMLAGLTKDSREWREYPDPFWSKVFNEPMTPRYALQYIGTQLFRAWTPNFWVAAAARRIAEDGVTIFTDARFRNELGLVQNQMGTNIWVHRSQNHWLSASIDAMLTDIVDASTDLKDPQGSAHITLPDFAGAGLHESEYRFLTDARDYLDVVVLNRTSIDDLHAMIRHIHARRDDKRLPWRKHTLYLTVVRDDPFAPAFFKWSWKTPSPVVEWIPVTASD